MKSSTPLLALTLVLILFGAGVVASCDDDSNPTAPEAGVLSIDFQVLVKIEVDTAAGQTKPDTTIIEHTRRTFVGLGTLLDEYGQPVPDAFDSNNPRIRFLAERGCRDREGDTCVDAEAANWIEVWVEHDEEEWPETSATTPEWVAGDRRYVFTYRKDLAY